MLLQHFDPVFRFHSVFCFASVFMESADMNTDNEARYWNTKRAADYLGVSPDTLNRMRLTGDGPRYAKLGGRVIYDPSDIDAWVEANKRSFTHEKITP